MTSRIEGWKVLGTLCCLALFGEGMAQVRTSPAPSDEPTLRELRPTAVFDKAEATAALAGGTSSIVGVACSYHDSLYYTPAARDVMLFPATAYFDEFFAMRKKANPRKEVVRMSEEAYNTRVQSVTDDKGRFQFTEMSPGRYYLYMEFQFDQAVSRNVYAGTSDTGYGNVNHYRREDYSIERNDVMVNQVEVKADGSTVKTALFTGGGIFEKMRPCK